MKVVKRDGKKVEFDAEKIENAILKAMKCGSGIVDEKCAHDIAVEIEDWHKYDGSNISIYRIEGQVFEKLIEKGVHIMASDGKILINGGVCHFEVRLQTEEPIQVVTQGEQQRNEHNRDND